jgi:hypothetical protein
MKRLVRACVGFVLLLAIYAPAWGADGCCVCGDGRCLNDVAGIKQCISRCGPSETIAYNEASTCGDRCLRLANQVRRERLAEKGDKR